MSTEQHEEMRSDRGHPETGDGAPSISLASVVIMLYVVSLLAAVLAANGMQSEGPNQFESGHPRQIVAD